MIIRLIRAAVQAKDPVLLKKALDDAEASGLTDRQCFRLALAADPSLTNNEWTDLKARS